MAHRLFFPCLGGVEFHILNLSRELVRRGCRVTVVCRQAQGLPPREVHQGIEVRRVAGLWALGAVMREKWDVVHVHMPRNLWSLMALVAAQRAGIPTVFTPHCFYPSSDWLWKILKALVDRTMTPLMFRLADLTINLTPNDQRDSLARGLNADRSRLIPNSVSVGELGAVAPVDFRARYGLQGEFLLHVGRFDRVKRIDLLVQWHTELSDLSLVLIGQDDGTLPAVRGLVSALGLGTRVRIIPRASFRELCGAYRQAAALVMATAY
ncbi:MAG: glycosyltransferase family 4 protein, partial [Gemmatimonadaceae bacterium]